MCLFTFRPLYVKFIISFLCCHVCCCSQFYIFPSFFLFRPARLARPRSLFLKLLTSCQPFIPVFSMASSPRMTPLKEVTHSDDFCSLVGNLRPQTQNMLFICRCQKQIIVNNLIIIVSFEMPICTSAHELCNNLISSARSIPSSCSTERRKLAHCPRGALDLSRAKLLPYKGNLLAEIEHIIFQVYFFYIPFYKSCSYLQSFLFRYVAPPCFYSMDKLATLVFLRPLVHGQVSVGCSLQPHGWIKLNRTHWPFN